MTAFWNYVLLTELARRIVYRDSDYAFRDPDRLSLLNRVRDIYSRYDPGGREDFSERLLAAVDDLLELCKDVPVAQMGGHITNKLYSREIHELSDAVSEWLAVKDEVWMLVDNIDKGWPTRGASPTDIVIVRSLLEASRKLQRQMSARNIELHSLVFLRSDIYDHLLQETADRGKDTAISLHWDDVEAFEELVRARIQESTGLDGAFADLWPRLFQSHVGTTESFSYIAERTMMRPRELLHFLHRCVEVALNRNHVTVTDQDILQAERSYSEDLLLSTAFEIGDTYPEFANVIYAFERSTVALTPVEVGQVVATVVAESDRERIIDLLLWFGFLGVLEPGHDPVFSYHVRDNVGRLHAIVQSGRAAYCIHPGFHQALRVTA